jgi:hypothetical protein
MTGDGLGSGLVPPRTTLHICSGAAAGVADIMGFEACPVPRTEIATEDVVDFIERSVPVQFTGTVVVKVPTSAAADTAKLEMLEETVHAKALAALQATLCMEPHVESAAFDGTLENLGIDDGTALHDEAERVWEATIVDSVLGSWKSFENEN